MTHVTIDAAALRDAAEFSARIANPYSNLLITRYVLIERKDDDEATLRSTNLEVWGTVTVPCSGDGWLRLAVPAAELAAMLKNALGPVQIYEHGIKAAFTANRGSFMLNTQPADDFPDPFTFDVKCSYCMDGKTLSEAIAKSKAAIPRRDPRRVLLGAYFDMRDDGLRIASTDGKVMVVLKRDVEAHAGEYLGIIVPLPVLEMVAREKRGMIRFDFEGAVSSGESGGFGALSFGNKRLEFKAIDGMFPRYERVVPTEREVHITFDVKPCLDLMKQASGVLDKSKDDYGEELHFDTDGFLRIAALGRDGGRFEGMIDAEYPFAAPYRIIFNWDFFSKMLKASKAKRVTLKCNDPSTPAIFHDVQDHAEADTFLVMPIREAEYDDEHAEDEEPEEEEEEHEIDEELDAALAEELAHPSSFFFCTDAPTSYDGPSTTYYGENKGTCKGRPIRVVEVMASTAKAQEMRYNSGLFFCIPFDEWEKFAPGIMDDDTPDTAHLDADPPAAMGAKAPTTTHLDELKADGMYVERTLDDSDPEDEDGEVVVEQEIPITIGGHACTAAYTNHGEGWEVFCPGMGTVGTGSNVDDAIQEAADKLAETHDDDAVDFDPASVDFASLFGEAVSEPTVASETAESSQESPEAPEPVSEPATAPAGGPNVAYLEDAPDENRVRIRFDRKPSNETRQALKDNGFWWAPTKNAWSGSRKAKRLAWAHEFVARFNGDGNTPSPTPPNCPNDPPKVERNQEHAKPAAPTTLTPEKLRGWADSMTKTIEANLNPGIGNQNYTERRARIARGIRAEGMALAEVQATMRAMANAIEADAWEYIPEQMLGFRFKKEFVERYDWTKATVAEAEAMRERYGERSSSLEEARAKSEAQAFEAKWRPLVGNLKGFFPTPRPVVDRMIELAGGVSGKNVLEPSAGAGHIAVAARDAGANVACIEYNYGLQKLLVEQGLVIVLGVDDFLKACHAHTRGVDVILMNPPFENGQDIDHVRHAYSIATPGTTIVSVMSNGPWFRSDRKATEFREWFDGEKIDLPSDAFKEMGTGVQTCLVRLVK